jgi:hypothetical protein
MFLPLISCLFLQVMQGCAPGVIDAAIASVLAAAVKA